MNEMNWTELLVAGLIGTALGLIGTIFLTYSLPLVDDKFTTSLIKIFGSRSFSKKRKMAGMWSQNWSTDSPQFQSVDDTKDDNVVINQFMNRVWAEYKSKGETYILDGKIDKDMYLTGTWKNIDSGNMYHGSFQLRIETGQKVMKGIWNGFSDTSPIVRSGEWVWSRK